MLERIAAGGDVLIVVNLELLNADMGKAKISRIMDVDGWSVPFPRGCLYQQRCQ